MVSTQSATFTLYECMPVDMWTGWTRLAVHWQAGALKIADVYRECPSCTVNDVIATSQNMGEGFPKADIATEIEHVALGFKQIGWEGDLGRLGAWMLGALPNPETCDSLRLYAVKQDNNGTTFIASPKELPWLKTYKKTTISVRYQ